MEKSDSCFGITTVFVMAFLFLNPVLPLVERLFTYLLFTALEILLASFRFILLNMSYTEIDIFIGTAYLSSLFSPTKYLFKFCFIC